MPVTYARPELIASPDWLAEQLGDRRPDRRPSLSRRRHRPPGARRGHIPGAVTSIGHRAVDPDDPPPFQLAASRLWHGRPGRHGGGVTESPVGTFVFHPAHDHWHFEHFAAYELWTRDAYDAWLASGRPTSSAVARIEPSVLTPRGVPRLRLATADVNALLGSQGVESSTPARRPNTTVKRQRQAAGAYPGAINVPSALPRARLRRLPRTRPPSAPSPKRVCAVTAGRAYDGAGIGAAGRPSP
jgi:3-mercaptopyruvate sulfurtransferase SseA